MFDIHRVSLLGGAAVDFHSQKRHASGRASRAAWDVVIITGTDFVRRMSFSARDVPQKNTFSNAFSRTK
jgi:hypothetical protein